MPGPDFRTMTTNQVDLAVFMQQECVAARILRNTCAGATLRLAAGYAATNPDDCSSLCTVRLGTKAGFFVVCSV